MKSLEQLRRKLQHAEPFHGAFRRLGGHAQTLAGHFLPTRKSSDIAFERVEMPIADGDRLVGFLAQPSHTPSKGVLHVFHGLSGSTESPYMPRAASSAVQVGFSVVLWNHRGCGAGRNLALETYHSGRSDDLGRVVHWGRDRFQGTHGVLGYSLSANATCLLAAQVVPAIDSAPLSKMQFEKELRASLPDFAIAINPPFDLKRASDRLTYGPARIYGQSFMPSLLEGLEDRAAWNPENEKRQAIRNLAFRARKKLNRFTDVETFDATFTGPAGGFRDHLDYYSRASCGQFLQQTKVPLIILSAEDDPITHGFADLPRDLLTNFNHPLVLIDAQTQGGHMGYVDHDTLKTAFPAFQAKRLTNSQSNPSRWLERRIQLYLHAFLPENAGAMS